MSSAALVPSSFECPAPSSPAARRPFLAAVTSAGATLPAATERQPSVPLAPSVARLHAGPPALSAVPAHAVGPTRAPREALGSELIAMLPSLERRAYRWCRDAAEAQDLAQDTVLRALGKKPLFDSEGHLRAWLYTVLRNLFISRRRRDQSWQRASNELGVATPVPTAAPQGFLTPSVERAIASLPEAFARVICLVDLEDYSYADAASTLGVPVGTVMSRLFRARQRLAQQLPALV